MPTAVRCLAPGTAISALLVCIGCSELAGPSRPADTASALFPDCAGPATVLDPAVSATLPPAVEGSWDPNSHWAALAARVPGGFAGAYRDNGVPILLLVDVSQAAAAKQALAGMLSEHFDLANAEVREARWDFDQLRDWMYYLWLRQGIGPGGTSGGIGLDVSGNRVLFMVEDARQRDRMLRELAAIDLPCGLVSIQVVGVFRDD